MKDGAGDSCRSGATERDGVVCEWCSRLGGCHARGVMPCDGGDLSGANGVEAGQARRIRRVVETRRRRVLTDPGMAK